MEFFSVQKTFQHPHLGEEKQQMLNLNRRLETYLGRVKHLEEENAQLAKEIQALRRSGHGALTRRKGLEEELRRGRLEVDAAWRDRVYMEMEVERLVEELQTLDQLRQKEARAQLEAKTKLERSRKELEEEQRAQLWLRQKISQLENEMRHLIQTHEEDVAHLEAKLTLSRTAMPPALMQRGQQTPNLLELGEEFSQRATRAWQEAAEAYQGQLAQLEESLNQTRSRLTQVEKEKGEGRLKLQALEKEIASAQDIRIHLEKTAAQQGQRYDQEIQELQEHLEGLEAEKEELGQQIEGILLENRGLLQAKMSLGLEVATYRALLDGESLQENVSQRNISVTDAAFNPHGVKRNYQLSAGHKTTSYSSVRGLRGTGPVKTIPPVWSRKPVTHTETPKTSIKPASATPEPPYPKILQDGAVENFRPQEVQEKVTYAEPLSPPNEWEAPSKATEDTEGEEARVAESVISHQNREAPLKDQCDALNFTPYSVKIKEELRSFSEDSDLDVPLDIPAEKQDVDVPCAPISAWEERKYTGTHAQGETSDSETEAVREPNFGSRTSSPVSECEPEDGGDEDILKADAEELKQELSCPLTNKNDTEDKLYPDGEEMDTWDSVMERKVERKDDGMKTEAEKLQHAEPEEDISAREQKHEKKPELQQQKNVTSSVLDTDVAPDQDHALLSDNEEDEDSQNVSVSWRTELESDSYAQENTLADTRPLIRYKSDETDANTHASHMDESESSEGEQEKKVGEVGTGMWGDGKSKKFGTMEDLCEDAEGEDALDEYDLGYTQGNGGAGREEATLMNANESAEELFRKVSEGHWDVGNADLTKTTVDYDEELETDRLVEQELENLATDSYSAHFAQQHVSRSDDILHLMTKSDKNIEVQEDDGKTKTDDTSSCAEPEVAMHHELSPFTSVISQPFEILHFSDSPPVMPQRETDSLAQHGDQDASEQVEEGHNASMVTHADPIDQTGVGDFLDMPSHEDNQEEPKSPGLEISQEVARPTEEAVSVDESTVSQEIQDVEKCEEFPDVPETAEWDVLDSQFEMRDQNESWDNVPKSADFNKEFMVEEGEPLEMSPESIPEKNDIFSVKESEELLSITDKDKSLHGFFSSGVQSDLWMSSLETGATYQPDDACNEAAEQTNRNQGLADTSDWGNLENTNRAYENSKVDIDSAKAFAGKAENKEMKQMLSRNVEGEFVHSEESEVEGESWSSGEEAV